MKKWALIKGGVPADQLDEKAAALKSTETQGMTPDERRQKYVKKKAAKKKAAESA
jgi:hypothetical protein